LEQPVHAPYGLAVAGDGAVRWFRFFFVPVRDGHVLLAQRVPPEVDLGPASLFEPTDARLSRWWQRFERGLEAAAAGQADSAEGELLAAAEAADEAGPPGQLPLAETLENLARVVDAAGRPDDARALYERALGVKQEAVGPGSPLLVSCLAGLGDLAARQGQFEDATERLRAALSQVELAYGDEDLQAAWLLERVGRACAAQGQTAEAAACQQEAAALARRLIEAEPEQNERGSEQARDGG
jgi:tetratricopeptide (TPR) repeat protein